MRQMDRVDTLEDEEYALYNEEKPLRKEEYVFDHFSDGAKHVTLSFRRVTWLFPLHG